MKKSRLLIVLAGLAVVASGCGYSTGGEDSTVTVIEATNSRTYTRSDTNSGSNTNSGSGNVSDSKWCEYHKTKRNLLYR